MVLRVDVGEIPFSLVCTLSNGKRIDVQELFGAHYELPDLGPLGGHGLANARDFEVPLACFDIDQSPWESKSASFHISPRSDVSRCSRVQV